MRFVFFGCVGSLEWSGLFKREGGMVEYSGYVPGVVRRWKVFGSSLARSGGSCSILFLIGRGRSGRRVCLGGCLGVLG